MATTSMWPIHNTGKRAVKAIVNQVVSYAENENKTKMSGESGQESNQRMKQDSGVNMSRGSPGDSKETVQSIMSYVSDKNEGMKFVTGINCTPEHAVEEMMITKRRWPDRGNRVLYHGYQSFLPGEVTPEQAHRIGVRLARELWGDRFEIVVATHLDRAHLHNHLVVNAMSFVDGTKFIWDEEYPRMQLKSDEICKEEGLSVVPPNLDNEATKNIGAIHAGLRGLPTVESIVKEDIDSCIALANSLQEWYQLMEAKGYRIDDSRKYLRVWPYGHSKCIRIDRRFGEAYSPEGLEQQILSHGLVSQPEDDEEIKAGELFESMLNSTEVAGASTGVTESESIHGNGRTDKRSNDQTTGLNHNRKHSVGKAPGRRGPFRHDPIIAVHTRLMLPIGIQITYIRFIVRMGYRRTPAQVARIHYLYREELTKLDRYISEAKYLIANDIHTEDELRDRKSMADRDIHLLKNQMQKLYQRSRYHPEQKEMIVQEIRETAAQLKEAKRDFRFCQSILGRMETIRRKEDMVRKLKEGPERGLRRENDIQRVHQREAEYAELDGE